MTETLVIRAEIRELGRVCGWADALARRLALPQSTTFAIQLCFEEALSNIVRHGFAGAPEEEAGNKEVSLALETHNDAIVATIEDCGPAFNPLEIPPPVAPTTIGDLPLGGRGIQLMRKFAQSVDYERRDGVNRLTLSFTYSGRA